MSMVTNCLPNLDEAVRKANGVLQEKGYTAVVVNEEVKPKDPIFLQLRLSSKEARAIGIIHLVHLRGENWDSLPLEEVVRTTDEVAQAIIERVALFFDAQARQLFIDEHGTIFDFNEVKVEVHEDKTFSVEDTVVRVGETPLQLSRLKSEGIVKFIKQGNGDTHLFDSIDQRQGKGIFIDTTGKIYRA